ncbi:MAG: acyltransferase domain-containing protein, partial [Bacteroidetes bacterium]
MPLTTNGKIDRAALPEPPRQRPPLQTPYAAPLDPLEGEICRLWEQLLEVEPVGRHDRFFELGGNSILAARFIGKLSERMGESIFITTIFDHPTPAQYAAFLRKAYRIEALQSERQSEEQPLDEKAFEAFPAFVPRTLKGDAPEAGEPLEPALFILAPPRSGTSLLRLMLAGHPELFAVNELHLLNFHTLAERERHYSGKFALWKEGLLRVVMELRNCDAERAAEIVQQWTHMGWTTRQAYEQLQRWCAPRMLVEKTPAYALDPLALRRAEHLFRQPLYVHLVRHPYSSVRSFEKYHLDQVLFLEEHPHSPRELAELVWWHSHRNIAAFLQGIPAERHFFLRYEELVSDPEKALRRLCSHFGLPFHEGLLQPYQGIEKKLTDGIHEGSRSMSDSNLERYGRIRPEKAREWEAVREDNFLAPATWALAVELGYEGIEDLRKRGFEEAREGGFEDLGKRGFEDLGKRGFEGLREGGFEDLRKRRFEDSGERGFEGLKRGKSSRGSEEKGERLEVGGGVGEPIAIVGMACRLPGADSPEEFWEKLLRGEDLGRAVRPEDLQEEGLDPALLEEENYVARTYALRQPYHFDGAFFGILPREAEIMDPQHRVLLETAWWALEDAGCDPFRYAGRIGVFGGVARNSYLTNNIGTYPERLAAAGDYQNMLASESSFSISRVAYLLNLRGPAVNVQTACSTGGAALHLACQSLRQGDCDAALVVGGRIQPPVLGGYRYTEGGPLSPDGYCRAFDARANGMVQGNGMVALLLKPLSRARADGDSVRALIRGSALNNDGSRKTGFTAPSPSGHAELIVQALQNAGLSAEDLSYIEAHGTGTLIGDPIEVQGLTQAFRRFTERKGFCRIGSVKTNISHLDAGACLAGVLKTVLALENNILPPSLHFSEPNPQIPWDESPFVVNALPTEWPRSEKPRRAGVSSFGLGGTNAHLILEEAPEPEPRRTAPPPDEQLLLLSAKTESAAQALEERLLRHLESNPVPLPDAAFTLATGRAQLSHRRALVVRREGAGLKTLARVASSPSPHPPTPVFLFPGGGAQYPGMGRELYEALPAYRRPFDRCLQILKENHGLELQSFLFPEGEDEALAEALQQPSKALPALFAVEYALAQTLLGWGLQPAALIGHSMGEYTAACLAGVMSLEEALGLVAVRGRLFEQLPADGSMLSVPLSEEGLKPLMDNGLVIAVVNRPDSCVVSGGVESIEKLERKLRREGIEPARLHIAVAAHSPQVEPILNDFRRYLEQVDLQPPRIPFVSNVTGTWIEEAQATSVDYWLEHLRRTVRFSDGLKTLFEGGHRCLIEVGPGRTLSTFALQNPFKPADALVLSTLRHPKEPANGPALL